MVLQSSTESRVVYRRHSNDQGTRPRNALAQIVEKIIAFLDRWLVHQIIDSDKRMAEILRGLEFGIQLLDAKARADQKLKGSFGVLVDTVLTMNATPSNHTIVLMRELEVHRRMQEQLETKNRSLEKAFITYQLTKL
jgi:hypothetical protein